MRTGDKQQVEQGMLEDMPRPERIAKMNPDVAYLLEMARPIDDDLRKGMPQLDAAAGIAFDSQGDPRGFSPGTKLSRLSSEAPPGAPWRVETL